MNYKIITIAIALLLVFACQTIEQEQALKKEADKQTEIPIVYTNEKGIATKEAFYKQLNIKGLYYIYATSEAYFKPTEETAPDEQPIGEWISPFELDFHEGLPPSYKLKKKGTRGHVILFFHKTIPWEPPEEELIEISVWVVWE